MFSQMIWCRWYIQNTWSKREIINKATIFKIVLFHCALFFFQVMILLDKVYFIFLFCQVSLDYAYRDLIFSCNCFSWIMVKLSKTISMKKIKTFSEYFFLPNTAASLLHDRINIFEHIKKKHGQDIWCS